jgi:hypothetical protein
LYREIINGGENRNSGDRSRLEISLSSGENSDRGINGGNGEDIRGEHRHSGDSNGGDGGENRVPKSI